MHKEQLWNFLVDQKRVLISEFFCTGQSLRKCGDTIFFCQFSAKIIHISLDMGGKTSYNTMFVGICTHKNQYIVIGLCLIIAL